jgi:YegS/Rv2252/BmrU family lipid kinase
MSVLVNTHSTRYPAEIEPLLAPLAASHDMTLVRVDRPEEFSRHIEATARSSEVIVIGSGDGTLARSGHALIESGCTIGVLPFGNANDLARGLGMPLDLAAACRALVDAEPRAIDVGLVNGHCFFNAAVIGLGAKVSAAMDASRKKRWKRFSQLPHFLSALLGRRSFGLTVQTDAWTSRMRSIHFTVANGRTIGGGVTVDEDAWLDDGELDVSSVRPQSLSELLMLAPAMMTGRRRHHPQVDFMRRTSLRVETKRRMKVATDGDIVTETPADFECRPAAVRFLVPRQPQATLALAPGTDKNAKRSHSG